MFRLIKNSCFLLLLLVLADRLTGNMLEHFFYKQHHGDDYITIQVLDSTKADILIMGSSRASHHYIPDSITRHTGIACYNGGRDNMGIHYTRACLHEVFKRYRPSFVILDIIPYNFILDNQHNEKYFDVQTAVLLPFCNKHQGLYHHVRQIDELEVWKARLIKTYAFNSLAGTIVQNAFTRLGHKQDKGYEPLYGQIDSVNYGKQIFAFPSIRAGIDTSAFRILQDCLSMCREQGVKAIISFSPFYFPYKHEEKLMNEFYRLGKDFDATIVDYSSDTAFAQKPRFFYDELHLNHDGASRFSHQIAVQIQAMKK
jgi:hypothetical protein